MLMLRERDTLFRPRATIESAETVRVEHFDAERHVEGALVVRSADGVTLVFADSLFNLPHQKGVWWWFYGRVLGSTGGPRVTAISRAMMLLTRSKRAFRDFLDRWAQTGEVVRLIPGHGSPIVDDANVVLRSVIDSL